jgi:hypothetical protein
MDTGTRRIALALAIALAAPLLPGQLETIALETIADDLRATARLLPFVMADEMSFGRERWGPAPRADLEACEAGLRAARAAAFDPRTALPLLDAPDSKVRVMAAYAVFLAARPDDLAALARHVDDAGEVPNLPRSLGLTMEMHRARVERLPPLEPVKVGTVVRSFLAAWGAPEPGTAEFRDWSGRQRRFAPTARELRLRMRLATGASMPIDAAMPLLEVLGHAARAGRGAREIAQIALFHDKIHAVVGRYAGVEQSLVFAARRLGRDNLLRVLRDEAPIVDGEPLVPEQTEDLLEGVRAFVLRDPARVGLEPGDSEALIAIGEATDRHAMFAAAARLRPDRATPILRAALARTQNPFSAPARVDCAILLWELAAEANREFLETWYHEVTNAARFVPEPRQRFLTHLLESYGRADRALFARLVHETRFDRIEPQALLELVHTVNATRLDPVVPPESILDFNHPLGLEAAFRDIERAREAWPEQTATMLERMAGWRQAIRDHCADWLRD